MQDIYTATREVDNLSTLSPDNNLPEGWRVVRLGEVGTVSGGSTPSTTVPEYWDGTIAWLVPGDVTKCTDIFISKTSRTITEAGLASCGTKLLPPGTVMMTSRATIGEVVINRIPMATNQGFINVICNQEVVFNEYLAYWIKQNKRVFEERANGVTFKEISKSSFKTILLPLPPLPEQRAIAQALRTAQAAVQARRREAALERERKAALMQHLFTKGTRCEPTKLTEIGEVPVSWEVVQLASVARFESGGTPSKEREDWWQGSIPWVSPKDLKKPRLADTADHITEEALAEGSRLAPKGTVFIVVRGMILAKDVPVAIADVPMAFNQDLKAIFPGDRLFPDFLLYTLMQRKEDLGRLIGTSAHGTKRIGTSALEAFLVPIPPQTEQSVIAAILRACDEKIAALEREAALLDELFRALLEELMTGRLRAGALIDHA